MVCSFGKQYPLNLIVLNNYNIDFKLNLALFSFLKRKMKREKAVILHVISHTRPPPDPRKIIPVPKVLRFSGSFGDTVMC